MGFGKESQLIAGCCAHKACTFKQLGCDAVKFGLVEHLLRIVLCLGGTPKLQVGFGARQTGIEVVGVVLDDRGEFFDRLHVSTACHVYQSQVILYYVITLGSGTQFQCLVKQGFGLPQGVGV